MKRFIRTCLLFAVSAVIGAILLQRVVDYGLKKMTNHSSTQTSIAQLLSDTLNADILIMGNSRALCSYNPAVMEKVTGLRTWNIGVSGQPFGISYFRYQLYSQHNQLPKLLIINIDNNELEMIENGFGREEYYPYFSDSTVRSYLDIYGFTWKDFYIPMYKYFGDYKLIGYGLMSAVGLYPSPPQQHYHGFDNCDLPFDGEALRDVLRNNQLDSACCEADAVQLLDQFLAALRQQQVAVVLCYAPQYQELYRRLQLSDCMDVYRQLSEKYDVPILDYASVSWANDSSYFYNANHINRLGSELFSTQLSHDLDSIASKGHKK